MQWHKKHNHLVSSEHGTAENVWWKSNSKQLCLSFFTNGIYSFRRCNCNTEFIPNYRQSHRERTFANIQLVLGATTLFGIVLFKCRRDNKEI